MAQLLIKVLGSDNPGAYRPWMIVEVREDDAPRGTLEKWPAFAWIRIPEVPVAVVQKYAEPELSALTGLMTSRRRWQIRGADLPLAVRNKFNARGEITIKTGTYAGAYDYTWAQVRGYFRDQRTGSDEAGEL